MKIIITILGFLLLDACAYLLCLLHAPDPITYWLTFNAVVGIIAALAVMIAPWDGGKQVVVDTITNV